MVQQNQPEKKGRILIIRNAFRFDFGGGERIPVDLASELLKYGYEPFIISRAPKLLTYAESRNIKKIRGWWWSQQDWSGLRIILTPLYLLWEFVLIFWYLGVMITIRPKIVHAQSKDDFIAATLAATILRIPVYWSDYADLKYIYQNLSVWYKNPIGKIVKFCSRFTKAILLTSESDKRLIEESAGRQLGPKYTVMYYGVLDRPELLNSRYGGENIIFVATSRLVTAKGIGELIEATIKTRAKHPQAELWLFGEGPEKEKFEKMAASQDYIKFMGYPSDTLNQVAAADIFVHPSYLEGFSISLIEAAMLGKPIIACRVGGNTEIIVDGTNGILIREKDSEALAEAMDKLISDEKLRQKLGEQARLTYDKNYNFEYIVKEKFLPLYEN